MKLEVRFLGLCLFHASSPTPAAGETVTVLFPDARKSRKDKHKDGHGVGKDHTASLLFRSMPPQGIQREHRITNAQEVRFAGTPTGNPGPSDLSALVRIGAVADNLQFESTPQLKQALAGSVRLVGGRCEVVRADGPKWPEWIYFRNTLTNNGRIPRVQHVGRYVEWTCEYTDAVEIRIGGQLIGRLQSDTSLCILNTCDADRLGRCGNPDLPDEKSGDEDFDFKWYFDLFESDPSIDRRLNKKALPAPSKLSNPPPRAEFVQNRGCLSPFAWLLRLPLAPPMGGDPPHCLNAFADYPLPLGLFTSDDTPG